jgi:tetratricopeptide (TPR) repeat protein
VISFGDLVQKSVLLYSEVREMGFFDWLKTKFSRRENQLAPYRSGMLKANKGDFAGAIQDYTAAIKAEGLPADVLGMALFNRSLAYSALHENEKAAEDLSKVLKMPGLPENIKVAASQRQERMRRREA